MNFVGILWPSIIHPPTPHQTSIAFYFMFEYFHVMINEWAGYGWHTLATLQGLKKV
jgi:hypothetical protein